MSVEASTRPVWLGINSEGDALHRTLSGLRHDLE